jgi:hypothetical protein
VKSEIKTTIQTTDTHIYVLDYLLLDNTEEKTLLQVQHKIGPNYDDLVKSRLISRDDVGELYEVTYYIWLYYLSSVEYEN